MTSCLISNHDRSNDSDTDRVGLITVSGEEDELFSSRSGTPECSTSRVVKERAYTSLHITYETAEYDHVDERGQLLTGDHPTDSLFQVLCYG